MFVFCLVVGLFVFVCVLLVCCNCCLFVILSLLPNNVLLLVVSICCLIVVCRSCFEVVDIVCLFFSFVAVAKVSVEVAVLHHPFPSVFRSSY